MVDFAKTLGEALGADCRALPADDAVASLRRGTSLLAFGSFDFSVVELLGERILVARPREHLAPARLVSLLCELDEASPYPVVCSLGSLTPYLREALLRQRWGFLTDDGQAYVPGFLRLTSRRRLRPAQAVEPRGPAERQAYVFLAHHVGEPVTAADLVEATEMSYDLRDARPLPYRRHSTPRAHPRRAERPHQPLARDRCRCLHRARHAVLRQSRAQAPLRRGGRRRRSASGRPLRAREKVTARSTEQRACGASRARELRAIDAHETNARVCGVLVLTYDPTPFVEDGMVDRYTMVRTVNRTDEHVDLAVEEATKDCPHFRLA